MKRFAALLALALVCACNGQQPPADLAFIDLAARDGNFKETFQSNLQFLDLFSANRQQRPVLSEVACSLTSDSNLAFEHQQDIYAKGGIETTGVAAQGGLYRFRSTLQFWRASKDEMGSDEMLTNLALTAALEGKHTIP